MGDLESNDHLQVSSMSLSRSPEQFDGIQMDRGVEPTTAAIVGSFIGHSNRIGELGSMDS